MKNELTFMSTYILQMLLLYKYLKEIVSPVFDIYAIDIYVTYVRYIFYPEYIDRP